MLKTRSYYKCRSYTNGSLGRSEQMIENVGDESDESSFPASSLTSTSSRIAGPSITNVAMHIDPTYLSQQSACTPNSLMFQGEVMVLVLFYVYRTHW